MAGLYRWLSGGGLARDMMAAQVPGPPGRRHETAEQREARLSAQRPRRVFVARYARTHIHATARDGSPRNAMHSPSLWSNSGWRTKHLICSSLCLQDQFMQQLGVKGSDSNIIQVCHVTVRVVGVTV